MKNFQFRTNLTGRFSYAPGWANSLGMNVLCHKTLLRMFPRLKWAWGKRIRATISDRSLGKGSHRIWLGTRWNSLAGSFYWCWGRTTRVRGNLHRGADELLCRLFKAESQKVSRIRVWFKVEDID